MPSLFADLLEIKASEAVDRLYAEPLLITTQTGGMYFGSSATGVPKPAIGIVDINPVAITVQDQSGQDGYSPKLTGERVHISFDLRQFDVIADVPVQDCIITAKDRPSAPSYRVTRVEPDGINRIVCICEHGGRTVT